MTLNEQHSREEVLLCISRLVSVSSIFPLIIDIFFHNSSFIFYSSFQSGKLKKSDKLFFRTDQNLVFKANKAYIHSK